MSSFDNIIAVGSIDPTNARVMLFQTSGKFMHVPAAEMGFPLLAGDNVFTGTNEFDGATNFDGTVDFDGNVTIDGTLDVNGTSTFDAVATFNSIPSMAGGAIQFPATQVPSADANALDDYEEGTFTPGIEFGGSATGVTFNSRAGRYTKIGDVVYVRVQIDINNNGSGSGAAIITGLPFTTAVTSAAIFSAGSGFSGLTGHPLGAFSGTTIVLRQGSATSINNALTDSHIPNSCSFVIAGFYFV
jgi:hypothetical protein